MKTLNKKTETSKFKNLLLRSGAVLVSIFLIGLTVNAQGYWKQLFTEGSLDNFAMIIVSDASVNSSELKSIPVESNSETTFFHIETENDKPIDLEEWMTGEDYFNSYSLNITVEQDKELKLKDWMKNSNFFNTNHKLEKEKELEIEDWMIADNFWSI